MTRLRRLLWPAVGVVLLALALLTGVRLVQAQRAATAGKAALLAASTALTAHDVNAAERQLRTARTDFRRMRSALRGTGPVLPLARLTPLIRVQVRAMDTMAQAAQTTADAGLLLTPTARRLLAPGERSAGAAAVVQELSASRPQVAAAVRELVDARRRVGQLDGYRLLGPLAPAQRELERRLDEAVRLGAQGDQTLTVLLDLAGGAGPRSYLLLSQNPDEPRPAGGFMGTYGVLDGAAGKVRIARYGDSNTWNVQHPQSGIPVAQAPFIFGYADPPRPQKLGNANATPDWPTTAALAASIWQRGGEQPVDGVLTFTPLLVIRLLGAIGQVRVPGYPDVVTAANADQRLNFYTHGEAARGKTDEQRKDFVGALARAVLDRTLHAPAKQLPDIGRAVAAGLGQREAAVWSKRAVVQQAIARLGWDGALPDVGGDFYADAEFAFASKNGRALLRTFDHTVTLTADGSGVSSTTMTLRDTEKYVPGYNINSHAYLTPYGPQGGALTADSDRPDHSERDLHGHPTAGWLRTAEPLGSTQLKVGWRVPELLTPLSDGTWEYRLTWLPQPGHGGDVLRLDVVLPTGWHWVREGPPRLVKLVGPYTGHWVLAPDHK